MQLINMEMEKVFKYLGIENMSYMYKAKQLADFRLLAYITRDFKGREICLAKDFNFIGEDTNIIYEYNDLVAYKLV